MSENDDALEHAVIRDSGFRLEWADADLEHAELVDALEHAIHHLDASDCNDGQRVYEDTMRLRAFVEYLEAHPSLLAAPTPREEERMSGEVQVEGA